VYLWQFVVEIFPKKILLGENEQSATTRKYSARETSGYQYSELRF
jgi:hypothetical protein